MKEVISLMHQWGHTRLPLLLPGRYSPSNLTTQSTGCHLSLDEPSSLVSFCDGRNRWSLAVKLGPVLSRFVVSWVHRCNRILSTKATPSEAILQRYSPSTGKQTVSHHAPASGNLIFPQFKDCHSRQAAKALLRRDLLSFLSYLTSLPSFSYCICICNHFLPCPLFVLSIDFVHTFEPAVQNSIHSSPCASPYTGRLASRLGLFETFLFQFNKQHQPTRNILRL
jgi:hypothetical protein